jgi:hypothetical protein
MTAAPRLRLACPRLPLGPAGLHSDRRAVRAALSHGGAFWNPPDWTGLPQCVLLRETHTPLAPTRTREALVPDAGAFPVAL